MSEASPAFQPVGHSQIDELFDAIRRFYAEDGIHFDETLVRPALAQLLADPSLGRAFFLRDAADNTRAGYVVFTFGFDHEAGGRLATITDLFIEPTHRRQGLGRAALQFVADTCRAMGVRGLELQHERPNLRARVLYDSFGFRDNGRVAMYLPLG